MSIVVINLYPTNRWDNYKSYGSNPAPAGRSQAPWSTRALLSVCKWAEVISDTAGLGQCPRESPQHLKSPESMFLWIPLGWSSDGRSSWLSWEVFRHFWLHEIWKMHASWPPICAKDATFYGHPPHRNPGMMAMGRLWETPYWLLMTPMRKPTNQGKPRLGPCHSCQTQP